MERVEELTCLGFFLKTKCERCFLNNELYLIIFTHNYPIIFLSLRLSIFYIILKLMFITFFDKLYWFCEEVSLPL